MILTLTLTMSMTMTMNLPMLILGSTLQYKQAMS